MARRSARLGHLVGGASTISSAWLHFHLWRDFGYRHVPDVGVLFEAQAISSTVTGLLIVVVQRVWSALVGIGFALTTMMGFLVSVTIGLFNFRESWHAPNATLAFCLEGAAATLLLLATLEFTTNSPQT